MSTAPAVSYVVAAYNHERFIGETVRSILGQTFRDIELLVIDDGSPDGTARAAREAVGSDPRARVIRQRNRGVRATRNRGVRSTCGEFVSIVDSDDTLPPDRTARMVEALRGNPRAALVYGDAWVIDAQGRKLARRFDQYPPPDDGPFSERLFLDWCFTPAISVMFRRALFEKTGPFWGPGPNIDYLKWIELGLVGDAIRLGGDPLGCWRTHAANTSRPDARKKAALYAGLRKGLQALAKRHPDFAARIGRDRLRKRFARCHFMGGFHAGLLGDWDASGREFAAACRFDPSVVNLAARASALPLVRLLSYPAYRAVAHIKLGDESLR